MGRRTIFITGHGRSGTTWVGNTLRQASGALYYNEPCNPTARAGDYSAWFRYVRPNGNDLFFEMYLDAAFKGLISDGGGAWLRQRAYRRLLPGYRVVIKEVASFMSLEWIYKRHQPEVLIIIRHPCGVALSERNQGTPVDRPIKEMLEQTALVKDHLEPYISVMKKAKTPFEIYGAIWGARNRVLADLLPHYPQWKILFYEEICEDPMNCFHELFDHFGLRWSQRVQNFINRSTTEERPGLYAIHRVSLKQINKWKGEMKYSEIDQVRSFVEPFNLPFYNAESDWSST